jgi:hypothetical protein
MADPSFETELTRLFGQTPAFADHADFARRVEDRLNVGWTLRRSLIGVLGVAGGAIAVGQMVGANLILRVIAAGQASMSAAQHTANLAPTLITTILQAVGLRGVSVGAEGLWLALGLLALAGALLATRAIEEF